MKITSLTVEGAGRFNTSVTLGGFGDGVNLLCEPNEVGKSTLFRALRACLFERHSARNEALRQLGSDGLSLALVVTLRFEKDGSAYEVRKQFLRGASASLRRGGVEIARNAEADEELWRLLGVMPGSGRSVDEAAFGLLWVAQGHSFHLPQPSDAASGALGAAIEAEVGAMVGGERARTMLADLARDIGQELTEKKLPKTGGKLKEALDQCEALGRALAEAQGRLAAVDEQMSRLAGQRRQRAALADPAEGEALRRDLEAAEAELLAARQAQEKLAPVALRLEAAEAALAGAERAAAELAERAARIDDDRGRHAALALRLAALEEDERKAALELATARTQLSALDAAVEADEAEMARDRELQAAAAALAGRDRLASRRDALEALRARLADIDGALAGNPADVETLQTLDAVERELDRAAVRLEAGAARIALEPLVADIDGVTLGGESVTGPVSRSVTTPVDIVVAGRVRIAVLPPPGFGADHEAARSAAQAKLASLLARCGAAGTARLRQMGEARRALVSDRASLIAGLEAFDAGAKDLAGAIARLDADITRIDVQAARALAQAGLATPPEPAEIERRQALLEARRAETRVARARLDGLKDSANAALNAAARERGGLDAGKAGIERRLAGDLALLPDTERAGRMEAAAAEATRAARALALRTEELEALRRSTPDAAEIERLGNRVARLRDAGARRLDAIRDLDVAIAHLEGQIQNAGAEGLGEKAAALEDELALWRREAARRQHRVDVLRRLHDTIASCQDEQRERLNAPIKRHLKPFLTDLFPAAELDLGDRYAVSGIARSGAARERFELLSDGTKEQIAVLTRLAMGSLLAERGLAVPIVLDDALVYADDDRIERMFDALSRAAARQQVIVFTCRTRSFARLGGRRLTLSAT